MKIFNFVKNIKFVKERIFKVRYWVMRLVGFNEENDYSYFICLC